MIDNSNTPGAQRAVGIKANETEDEAALVKTWLGRLRREEKAHEKFRKRARVAMRAFEYGMTADASANGDSREPDAETDKCPIEPIWWSNCKITQAAIFNRQPKPDVRRRWTDSRTDKNLALAIERSLSYQMDVTPFDDHSNRAVAEFLAAGLGQTCVYLDEEREDKPVFNPMTRAVVPDPENPTQPLTKPVVVAQSVPLMYVPFDLFRWMPCKDWEDCRWVSFDEWLDAEAIEKKYRVYVDQRDKDSPGGSLAGDGSKGSKPGDGGYSRLHLVHRIWDKSKREVLTICSTFGEHSRRLLDVKPDPYKLKGFFPCPRPMMMNIRSGKLVPRPEYSYVRGKCEEIDKLAVRIAGLVDQVRDVSFFDASFGDKLTDAMNQPDGAKIAVPALIDKLKDAGALSIDGLIMREDLRAKVEVIVQLVQERERAKQSLFELTGIADIVRGATKASETATAQQLKSQWANVRLTDKMREVSMHFRSVFRIQAELISEHFEPAQITAQSGIELTPEMIAMMKSDLGRCYAIDIESDSTIAQDEEQERADRTAFAKEFTGFVSQVMPMVQQNMMPAGLANAALLFFVGSFKHGRILEEQIEQLPDTQAQLQQATQATQQAQQQAEQVSAQLQQMHADMQKQIDEQAKRAADAEQRAMELEMQLQAAQGKGDSPAKSMREMAAASKDAAQAQKTEVETALMQAQAVSGLAAPPMPM